MSKAETDIILNRTNVALSRSQRLVASWLPPKTQEEEAENPPKSEEEMRAEEEDIFTPVPETLGLGALLPQKHADGSWNRAELDSNDQLRRQLLGKNYQKIMREKAREKEGERLQKGGGGQPSDSGVDKPVGEAQKEDGDDDDDEEGRTAAIGKKTTQSRGQGQRQGQSKNQRKKKNKKRKADSNDNSDLDLDPQSQSQSQPHTEAETVGDESEPVRDGDGQTQDKDGEEGKDEVGKENPGNETLRGSKGRKKATSFLDEILAERSKRRKKR